MQQQQQRRCICTTLPSAGLQAYRCAQNPSLLQQQQQQHTTIMQSEHSTLCRNSTQHLGVVEASHLLRQPTKQRRHFNTWSCTGCERKGGEDPVYPQLQLFHILWAAVRLYVHIRVAAVYAGGSVVCKRRSPNMCSVVSAGCSVPYMATSVPLRLRR